MMYKLSDEYVIRNIIDECILVPKKSKENEENGFFTLNMTGKIIISGINEGKETDDIAAEICNAFEIDYDSAVADVEDFIREFMNIGIIKKL